MQDHLGFQWSNCGGGGFLDTSPSTPPTNGQLQHDGHDDDKIEAEGTLITISSRPSCAGTGTATIAASCHDVVLHGGGGGTVLPTINISRTTTTTHTQQQQQQQRPFLAAPPPILGDAFEILLASSRPCKTLLLSQAAAASSSSVPLHDGGTISTVPSLRSEHVAYGYGGPPPPDPAAAHRPRGRRPSVDNYKQQMGAAGAGRQWSAEHGGRAAACEERAAAAPARRPVVVPWKKPRLEQRSGSGSFTTIVPSFKVRKERLGDRIAALQQLVSPFGKTDTASVLMEAIGYIKFLQDQVKTLSRPYLKSSRSSKKLPSPTHQRVQLHHINPTPGCWNASAAGEEQEETTTRRRRRPDLRSRGLCLVPLSCTSYVTNENGTWVPPNFRRDY